MTATQYWFAASTEEFTPSEMIEHAKAAEEAGFDGLGTSDHFAPWFPDGRGSQAWIWLGAVGQVTTKPIGTGVTPAIHHYHPGLIAQAFMSLEELYPGRVYLGTGSGEALSEGLWTLGDPEAAPEIIEAYRAACSDNGKEEGEIILQAGFAWAEDEQAAIEGARRWKPTQLPELYRDDISDPDDMQRRADEQMTDQQFAKEGFLIASDPDEHVERIREIDAIGGTVTCLQLIGSADPMGSIRTYGERVLPALRAG